ncbi:MAG: hypothetical protein R2844_13715 [Caldilineales bacterium]
MSEPIDMKTEDLAAQAQRGARPESRQLCVSLGVDDLPDRVELWLA